MLTDNALGNLEPTSLTYKTSDRDGMYVAVSNAERTILRAWSRTDLSSSAGTSANPSPRSRKIPSTASSA